MVSGDAELARMRRARRLKCLFGGLSLSVAVMTIMMQWHIGSTPIKVLHEMFFDGETKPRTHYHKAEQPVVIADRRVQSIDDVPLKTNISRKRINSGRISADEQFGHVPVWKKKGPLVSERTVAIGCAVTTKGQTLNKDNIATEMPFFKGLLASFCRTASYPYDYHFYVGHDHTDPYFRQEGSHKIFENAFYHMTQTGCPKINVSLHMVECNHTGHPAWAQNDAMMGAYMDNIAYYYRVNDDTILETTGWTEKMTEELMRYMPPNVGVVGPWFKDGNIAILTHDFVHRTHLDIFGFYYPRIFTDWFADDWITGVYWPERSKKVAGVRVKHTMEMGNRYVVHFEKANRVQIEVEIGKQIIKRWLARKEHVEKGNFETDSKKIISMSLSDSSMDYLYGAMRYTQLVPILFPGWRSRIYTAKRPANSHKVLDIILHKLEMNEVEIIQLDNATTSQLPPSMWRLLVADDMSVERFVIRDPNTRPEEREAAALEGWLKVKSPLYCIRDHPNHASHSLIPNLIGGIPTMLKEKFGKSWRSLMRGYTSDVTFIEEVVWPVTKDSCFCHDSVSCKAWPGAQAFPVLRKENEFIGQRYDSNDQVIDNDDTLLWNKTFILPECVFVKDTGFQDEAVRAVIRNRPVIWSQDYHVTPIMDVKSLLSPIGVKVIDNSLSYYCGNVGTCARSLQVINRENGMRLTPELIDQFYKVYRGDLTMKRVTAFFCALPVAMCEAFVKFNKSMIVMATIRYEQARPEPQKWEALNDLLLNISKHPTSIVAANNLYDSKYIEYFTGIKPVVVPPYCAYLSDSYKPTRKQFLITPIHSTDLYDKFFTEFDDVILKKRIDLTLFPLRQLYPQYLFSDLAAHPGIVYIPYQVSMVSLTEQYRMNIPLFFPKLSLLAKWHVQYQVVRQRTWSGYMQKRASASMILGVDTDLPDPNNDIDEDAVAYWLKYADFYQWPHIIYFSSVDDLVEKMYTVDLDEISRRMKKYNDEVRKDIKEVWSELLLKLTKTKSPVPS